MKGLLRSTIRLLVGTTLTVTASLSPAQTPAQLEYERQQREYWRQQEQQRQEQQRQQQIMQDNARRQQEESQRYMQGTSPSGAAGGAPTNRAGGSAQGSGAVSAQLEQARQDWLKRPPLPPEKNPLLVGRWTRPASSGSHSSDQFAQLQALAKGGLCELVFGGGVFEFRTDRLIGMDNRTPPQELDRVEYRGDSKRVIVIPKTTFKLMDFEVEGPDRINWASQKCVLVRAGTASGSAATRAPAVASTAAAAAPSAASAAGGTLAISVGALSADKSSSAGRNFLVLKQDPQSALIQGGIKSTPYASVLQNWMRACIAKTPDCERGARALQPYILGRVTTDVNGHAQPATLPVGRYWILGDTKVGDKRLMWHELVDLKGDRSVTLDLHNALPVE